MAIEQPLYVAVVGPGQASTHELEAAEALGTALARGGAVVVCGGLGGVMEAACRGAARSGGTTIGLLPGLDRAAANRWATVSIATGLGELRNALVVRAADVVVAVGGAYGTLSEVALALKTGVPVIGIGTWAIEGIDAVQSPAEAAAKALAVAVGAGP